VQSLAPVQPWPGAHALQTGPPQSMAVSAPFFTESLQVGAWHTPPVHTPELQSVALVQPWPVVHGAQEGPPQSSPVSWPL
jgi:hypothetical protein